MSDLKKMDDFLISSIQNHCISHGLTVSLAESCTGGNLAGRLVRLPGCSNYFLGSVVAYSNEVKMDLLGVDEQALAEYGPVSAPIAGQMAMGVLKATGSDLSLAVTGIAGPDGGSDLAPVGTIWAAIGSQKREPLIWTFSLSGNRQEIIEECVEVLLSRFWLFIQEYR